MLLGDGRVRRPIAQLAGDGAEFVVRPAGGGRDDEAGVFDNHRDARSFFRLRPGEVRAEPQVMGEDKNRLARGLRQRRLLGGRRPLGEPVTALFHADAISEVIADHHVEAAKQPLAQEHVERHDFRRRAGNGQKHAVLHIAMQNELRAGSRFIEIDDFGGPGREIGESGVTHGRRGWLRSVRSLLGRPAESDGVQGAGTSRKRPVGVESRPALDLHQASMPVSLDQSLMSSAAYSPSLRR